ncbi:MAG: response regulator [Rhodocyclaceae bacterium]
MHALVHVVDDDDAFRVSLIRMLRAAGYDVRAYASVAEVLLEACLDGPGCFILDVNMPGPSGLELQAALARRNDPPPVIFVSGYLDVPTTVAAMKRGAVDFLTKPVRAEDLIAAVEGALAIDRAARETRARDRQCRVRFESLSQRDRDLLKRVAAGQLNREIAQQMGIAERTVKLHRARIMDALGAHSLPDLVRIADRLAQPTGQAH